MRAIETEYAGVLFRSRLEARWAFLFDTVAEQYEIPIRWFYEKEGFELPSGRYVPDFWLPDADGGTWVEIKANEPTEREQQLGLELGEATGKRVVILFGELEANHGWVRTSGYILHPYWDVPFEPYMCCACKAFGFEFGPRVRHPKFHTECVCPHRAPPCRKHVPDCIYTSASAKRFWNPLEVRR